mgnify:CR=1 FL=1
MIVSGVERSITYNNERSIEEVFGDMLGTNGERMAPETVEKIGAVAAAHRIFTNSIAAMPWQIRQRINEERIDAVHPVSTILKERANAYMAAYLCEKTILSQAFFHGVGYAVIERGKDGRPVAILPVPIQPEIYVNPNDGVRWYRFTIPQTEIFSHEISGSFTESQLLIYRFESYDGSVGRGLLDMARDAMDTDIKAQRYGNRFYANGARPSGVLEVEGNLDQGKRDMLREEFMKRYSGENAFRVAVLDLGMKYTNLGISQQDAQYIESRQFTVSEISRFTGIPAYMMQEGKQSYNANEQQKVDFLVDTLTPHIVQIEQEWASKLFSTKERQDGFYLKKNVAGILRGTHEARAQFYEKMISIGGMNADEVRANEDRPPIPGGYGQKFWMSKNYAPVDMPQAFDKSGNGANTAKGES